MLAAGIFLWGCRTPSVSLAIWPGMLVIPVSFLASLPFFLPCFSSHGSHVQLHCGMGVTMCAAGDLAMCAAVCCLSLTMVPVSEPRHIVTPMSHVQHAADTEFVDGDVGYSLHMSQVRTTCPASGMLVILPPGHLSLLPFPVALCRG